MTNNQGRLLDLAIEAHNTSKDNKEVGISILQQMGNLMETMPIKEIYDLLTSLISLNDIFIATRKSIEEKIK